MSHKLPARPDMGQLRTQAKDLRRLVVGGNPAALARVGEVHKTVDPETFSLRDAQLVIARELGYPGWTDLVAAIGDRADPDRDLNRWLGVQLNNETWDRLDKVTPGSPPADPERLLYGAYASTYHWMTTASGTVANHARGEYMIATAALAVGLPETAMRHARRCARLVDDNPDVATDWDRAFAAQILARAYAATGDLDTAARHHAEATRLTAEVADPEDKAIVLEQLARGPWYGLTA